jgi:IS1 family transposase
LDEAWSFCFKKQARLTPEDGADKGDQYVFLAIAGAAKAILSYCIGKRNQEHTSAFVADLRARVLRAPEISSDGWNCYPGAIEDAFGIDVTYGQIEKHYGVQAGIVEAARRYSPAQVVVVSKRLVVGRPSYISTSYVERQNLTLRMQQRRFTRLTNAFSKKLENHKAAVALYAAAFNFCRVHETLRVTPAMQLGVTGHIWSIGELVDAALSNEAPKPVGRNVGPFRVIDGGRS